jgi:hypothetical protein
MILYLWEIIKNHCCLGKPEKRLVDELKDDIKELTEAELNHLRAFLIRPLQDRHRNQCC